MKKTVFAIILGISTTFYARSETLSQTKDHMLGIWTFDKPATIAFNKENHSEFMQAIENIPSMTWTFSKSGFLSVVGGSPSEASQWYDLIEDSSGDRHLLTTVLGDGRYMLFKYNFDGDTLMINAISRAKDGSEDPILDTIIFKKKAEHGAVATP